MENPEFDKYLDRFEDSVNQIIYKFLISKDAVDKILPEAPDIEEKWEPICLAYLPDGVREFSDYPVASLGWMMFIGMAIAKMWDGDWQTQSKLPDLYAMLRDVRGYDCLDDHICQDVLELDKAKEAEFSDLVEDTASLVYNALMNEGFEPGTPSAFNAYVRCLHQLYYFGAAVELRHLGYHMTPMSMDQLFDPLNMN